MDYRRVNFYLYLYVYKLLLFGFDLCHNANRHCIDLPLDKWKCKMKEMPIGQCNETCRKIPFLAFHTSESSENKLGLVLNNHAMNSLHICLCIHAGPGKGLVFVVFLRAAFVPFHKSE